MIKPVGACTPRYSGCRAAGGVTSPAVRRRTLPPLASPVASLSVPGFGLARARGRSSRGSRRGVSASSMARNWAAEKICRAKVSVQTAAQDCGEQLRCTHNELVRNLKPPVHVRAAWDGEQPAPNWMVCLVISGYLIGLLFLTAAFAGAPLPDCTVALTAPITQKANTVLMGALMFAAGGLLAVEHPVKWMMLIL